MSRYRAVLGPIAVVLLFIAGMYLSPFEPHPPPADPSGAPSGTVSWHDGDWTAFETAVTGALAAGLDTLPMGELMAGIGRGFVGTPFVAQTLEVEGPEHLVINFRSLDCVTFVENVYALAAMVKTGVGSRLGDRAVVEGEYERVLRTLRYRNGLIDGYSSRLHYFSDWIADNARRGLVVDLTRDLGGVPDPEPIDFMSTNADAFRQLVDPGLVEDIELVESRLTALGRYYLPAREIAGVAESIRNGDIIAATSTTDGLDVAHTGLALWVDGTLRLLHAPLVGEAVQISDVPLAERIMRIGGQDGIMVARPVEPVAATGGPTPDTDD